MTNEDKDKLLDKIKKMLAKAGNNPNEHEAALAANMAQELLARHNLTMADVPDDDQPDDLADIVTDGTIVTASHPWRRPLGSAVATMYFCKYMFVGAGGKNKHMFVGARHNVAVATVMYLYLLTTVERLAQEGSRSIPAQEKSPYRTTFRGACSTRLCARINERIRDAKQGTAMASTGTTLPALLSLYDRATSLNDAFIASKFGKLRQVTSRIRNLHAKGYYDGDAAGRNIGLDQQVAQQKAAKRISG
jgi:hypothetical protein